MHTNLVKCRILIGTKAKFQYYLQQGITLLLWLLIPAKYEDLYDELLCHKPMCGKKKKCMHIQFITYIANCEICIHLLHLLKTWKPCMQCSRLYFKLKLNSTTLILVCILYTPC